MTDAHFIFPDGQEESFYAGAIPPKGDLVSFDPSADLPHGPFVVESVEWRVVRPNVRYAIINLAATPNTEEGRNDE